MGKIRMTWLKCRNGISGTSVAPPMFEVKRDASSWEDIGASRWGGRGEWLIYKGTMLNVNNQKALCSSRCIRTCIFFGTRTTAGDNQKRNTLKIPRWQMLRRGYWATQRNNKASKHFPRSPKSHTIFIEGTAAGTTLRLRSHCHKHVFARFQLQIINIPQM